MSRTSHARLILDVRKLTGMQQSSSFLFCSFFRCFQCQKSSRDQPETAPDRGTDQQNRSQLQSWSSAPLQVTSVWAGIFQIFVVCWSKGWIVDKQVHIVKRHCQSAVDKNPERPDWPTRCHCFVCVLVTSNMSHGVNKSCITQHVVAQGGYTSEVVRNSQKNSLTLQEKALHFFFESATACLLWEPWRPGPDGHI